MAYDLARTTYQNTIERPVVTGVEIPAEGLVLKSVIVGDSEHLRTTEGLTGEVIVGFSHNNNLSITTEIVIEDSLSVPATPGPYTIQLSHPSIVPGSIRVHDVAGAADLVAGSTASGHFTIDTTLGLLTFNVAEQGKAVIVTYRRYLTAIEAQIKYRQRPINAPDASFNGNVVALVGSGEIYTDQYDTSVSYDGVSTLYGGANGVITSVSTGHTAIPGSRIVKLPTAASPFIGLRFNLA